MDEKPAEHRQFVVPAGATVIIVRASTIFAWVSVALSGLAILASSGLGNPGMGRSWERLCWGGAVASALLAFEIQLRRRGRFILRWSADRYGFVRAGTLAQYFERPLRLQFTTRSLFAFVTASALLIGYSALPSDFQELILVVALLSAVVGCIFFVAFAPHIGSRHLAILVIALLQLVAVAAIFGPFRAWFWR
jgi:hypothetical protein